MHTDPARQARNNRIATLHWDIINTHFLGMCSDVTSACAAGVRVKLPGVTYLYLDESGAMQSKEEDNERGLTTLSDSLVRSCDSWKTPAAVGE